MDASGLADNLAAWLDDAATARQLPDPNQEIAATARINDANSALYVRAARSRLVSLGYLDASEAGQDVVTPAFTAATQRFQAETGFTGDAVDGWIGPQTKERLQQLVSFEDGQDSREWGDLGRHPERYPAVARAAYLRLYALGFMDWSQRLAPQTNCQPAANPVMQTALQRFVAAASALGLTPAPLAPDLSAATVQLLFAYDDWVGALGRHPEFIAAPPNEQVIEATGRVELWLLGYGVTVAGKQEVQRRTVMAGPHGTPRIEITDPVDVALHDLWQRFPDTKAHAGEQRFSAAFFAQMAQLGSTTDHDADPGLQDALLAQAAANAPSLIDKLQHLAVSVWDGIKRLWGWLKRLVQTAANVVETGLWNLARLVAHGARKGCEVLLKAIDIVHHATVYWLGRSCPGGSPQTAMMVFKADFDCAMFVNALSDEQGGEQACGQHALALIANEERERSYFVEACAIWSLVLGALAEVLRVLVLGASTVGWFALLLALTRAVRQLADAGASIAHWAPEPGTSLYANPVA